VIREMLFREEIDLRSTTYATHGIYPYPAKFIPHVVRYAIQKYSKEGDIVFDPFAGHGTVAIEASLLGRNAICWDLNPLTEFITRASTFTGDIKISDFEIDWEYKKAFHPEFSNIMYWYPPEFYNVLSKLWGFWHREIYAPASSDEEIAKAYIISIPLLRLSKLFSYADEKVPKLYKSKYAKRKVEIFLSNNWRNVMVETYNKFANICFEKIQEYQYIATPQLFSNQKTNISVLTSKKFGNKLMVFDTIRERLGKNVELLITSPPYLQSQEYIRTFKLELAWLGYSTHDIREISKREIPYNEPSFKTVLSDTYQFYLQQVKSFEDKKLVNLYERYFYSLVSFFENNHEFLNTIAVFVGPAKIRNIRIPIDVILKEHLENRGFSHVETIIDKIVSRRLFKTVVNPSTKLEDERTPTEHLLVMKKIDK